MAWCNPPAGILGKPLLICFMVLFACNFCLLFFGTPPVFTAEKWVPLTPMTPISFMMTSQQPMRGMNQVFRIF